MNQTVVRAIRDIVPMKSSEKHLFWKNSQNEHLFRNRGQPATLLKKVQCNLHFPGKSQNIFREPKLQNTREQLTLITEINDLFLIF